MPKKSDLPLEFHAYITHFLNKRIIEDKAINKQDLNIRKHINKLEKVSLKLYESRNQLKGLVKGYKSKIEKEKRKNRELTSTYYLLAFNLLSEFPSEQTEELFSTIRKQIKVFIYSSFTNKIDLCLQSPAFQELFKRTENLELNFWYQERIAHASLLMQEFLSEAYGFNVEYDQIPETEMDLFESITNSYSQHMGYFDLDKYMNRIIGTAEESINDFNTYSSNAGFRRSYFEFAFKFSRYIGEQMSNIAQGIGLFDLSNQFVMYAEKLRLREKLSEHKENMEHLFSILPLNVPPGQENDPFWKNLKDRAFKSIVHFLDDEASFFQIEQEWIRQILNNRHSVIEDRSPGILCEILKLHTKILKGQIKLIELEGNYEHFSFLENEYDTNVDASVMMEILDQLKEENKEMEADIKFMQKSPDQLFQRIKEKAGTMHGFYLYNSETEPDDEFSEDLDSFFDEE